MIKKIIILISLICLNGCSGAVFEKGLNYKKNSDYEYEDENHATTIKNKENGKYINIRFGGESYCGFYGLFGPLIFPIFPFWENKDCDKVAISIWEHRVGIKNTHILYQNNIYNASEIYNGYYTFPLPIKSIKSITDTAILVVEKTDGEIFEIPFRYQHTFSFDLWPGR